MPHSADQLNEIEDIKSKLASSEYKIVDKSSRAKSDICCAVKIKHLKLTVFVHCFFNHG